MNYRFTKLLATVLIFIAGNSNAQTPIYHYTFDNTLNSLYNVATLTAPIALNANFGYTADRFGVANKAFKIYNSTSALYNLSASLLPQGTSARSFSLWAKYMGNNTNMLIKYGAGLNTANDNTYFGFTVDNTSVKLFGWVNPSTTAQTYTTGQWYHYAVTYDGATTYIYRNGILVLSEAKAWSTSGTALSIGLLNTGAYQMNAEIDDYQIYNRVLSNTEVQYLYSSPTPSIAAISASNIQKYSADINYSFNANNVNTTSIIRYGTSAVSLTNTVVGSNFNTNALTAAVNSLSGLQSSTTYYYQIETTNNLGVKVTSAINNFTTPNAGVSNVNLLGYYNFENNTNSHNGLHNFTPFSGYAAPNYVSESINGKAAFVPSLGTVLENTSLAPLLANTDFTIAFWEKKIDLSSGLNPLPTTFEVGGSFFWRYGSFSSMAYGMAVNTVVPSFVSGTGFVPATSPYVWRHVAFVKKKDASNNNLMYYYVDGVLTGTLPLGSSGIDFYQYNNKFTLFSGTNADATGTLNASKRTNGYLDELYIFNRALSSQEIFEVKNNLNGLLLPIKLEHFTATLVNSIAYLNWTTSQEINTSHFEIEYSNDGSNFTKVATINASGNSSNERKYTTTHVVNDGLLHYYRFKSVDNDGRFTYSNIVQLKSGIGLNQIKLTSSVTQNNTSLNFYSNKNGKCTITVTNALGQIVQQNVCKITPGYQTQMVSMSQLSKGLYYIHINVDTETSTVFKVIKI